MGTGSSPLFNLVFTSTPLLTHTHIHTHWVNPQTSSLLETGQEEFTEPNWITAVLLNRAKPSESRPRGLKAEWHFALQWCECFFFFHLFVDADFWAFLIQEIDWSDFLHESTERTEEKKWDWPKIPVCWSMSPSVQQGAIYSLALVCSYSSSYAGHKPRITFRDYFKSTNDFKLAECSKWSN